MIRSVSGNDSLGNEVIVLFQDSRLRRYTLKAGLILVVEPRIGTSSVAYASVSRICNRILYKYYLASELDKDVIY